MSAEPIQPTSKFDKTLFVLLFVTRCFVVLTTFVLLMIAILYAIGSLIILQADNFFCPGLSEKEVRLYNFENGNAIGHWGSCYYIDRKVVRWQYIYSLNINLFDAVFVNDTNGGAIFQCSMFVLVSICMFIIAIYHLYFIIYDTLFIIIDKPNPRIARSLKSIIKKCKRHVQKNDDVVDKHEERKVSNNIKCFGSIKSKFKQLQNDYYKQHYYPDSMLQLTGMWIKEMIEIMIQSYALFLYGGLNVFIPKQNILAQESYVVRGKQDWLTLVILSVPTKSRNDRY